MGRKLRLIMSDGYERINVTRLRAPLSSKPLGSFIQYILMVDNKTDSNSHEIEYQSIEGHGLRYAREKLGVAVWKLATGIEGIKARLADAFIELAILQESDFPPDLVNEWKQIKSDLTGGKMQYDIRVIDGELVEVPVGLLYSTLRYMRKNKAKDIARRICSLESKLDSRIVEIKRMKVSLHSPWMIVGCKLR